MSVCQNSPQNLSEQPLVNPSEPAASEPAAGVCQNEPVPETIRIGDPQPLYQSIARALLAMKSAEETGNEEWARMHWRRAAQLSHEHLPSGAGFDNGSKLDRSSTADKLVFLTAFHHMDESGGYDGWTEHQVVVKSSLAWGFELRVTGRDRNEIKSYIAECFGEDLGKLVSPWPVER